MMKQTTPKMCLQQIRYVKFVANKVIAFLNASTARRQSTLRTVLLPTLQVLIMSQTEFAHNDFCMLCKSVLIEDHSCTCHICSTPVNIEEDMICYRCEKITHVTNCCKQIRAPEKHYELRFICNHCFYALSVKISASAREQITGNCMLSDEHISRASLILSTQFGGKVGGLCAPMGVSYGSKVEETDFYPHRTDSIPWVQIMNTGKQHWVTAIFISSTNVKILDSINTIPITGYVKIQVAMIAFSKDRITVGRPPCMQQENAIDCGLFAIANATEFCCTQNTKFVEFDQRQLRSHLLQCLENGELTQFPRSSKRAKKAKELEEFEVISTYCKCRLPQNFDDMIECDRCGEWYHHSCVGPNSIEKSEWFCEHCMK